MSELESWLIGNAEAVTDIEFITRVIVFMVSVNIFASVAHSLTGISRR